MHILLHDFGGYPFPIQLSRELARQGYEVTHTYPIGLPGPKGRLQRSASDPEGLRIRAVQLPGHFRKYSACRRFTAHRKYAQDLRALICEVRPDIVLSGNTPIDLQAELLWHCRRNHIAFVHWVQDVYCQALEFFLRKRLPPLSKIMSVPFRKLETAVSQHSDGTVAIAPAFRDLLLSWGVPESKIVVLENWAPLDEIKPLPSENSWRKAHGLENKIVLLYSGTLGLKHRPDLLYSLARGLNPQCTVVVVTDGVGREYLNKLPPLENLLLLPLQPYDQVAEMLASADILLATLEWDAGQFAVPSKVLSYLCAGRPLLLAAPRSNLAATVVERSGAGFVVDPSDTAAWIMTAQKLASDKEYRRELGTRARQYAEQHFDIKRIAGEFEDILLRAFRCSAAPARTRRLIPEGQADQLRPQPVGPPKTPAAFKFRAG